jgi:hypothetical protein
MSLLIKRGLAAAEAYGIRSRRWPDKRETDRYALTLRPILVDLRHMPC